jgi:hypothetical protein
VSKILVSTGEPLKYGDGDTTTTEIIGGMTCQDLGSYPLGIYGGVGSTIGSFAVICGGREYNGSSYLSVKQCYKLVAGEWQQFATMNSERAFAAGVNVGNSLMIFGGLDSTVNSYKAALQSTEIIHEDGQVSQGPKMPNDKWGSEAGLLGHNIAVVNSSTLIISGGMANGIAYLTWYFNHITQKFQEGPSLMANRYHHASGTVVDHETNENIVVVAGGYGSDTLDSTELLLDGEWQQGKNISNDKMFLFASFVQVCIFVSKMKSLFLIIFIFFYFHFRSTDAKKDSRAYISSDWRRPLHYWRLFP